MSRFQENFLEIWKNANTKRVGKIFRSFFLRFSSFSSIESIVVGCRYYRIRQGIDTFAITSRIVFERHRVNDAIQYYTSANTVLVMSATYALREVLFGNWRISAATYAIRNCFSNVLLFFELIFLWVVWFVPHPVYW